MLGGHMHRRDGSMTTTVVHTCTASTVAELRCSVAITAYTNTFALDPYLHTSDYARKCASP
jgi:hypothetical protein